MQEICTSATGTALWPAKLPSQAMSSKHVVLEQWPMETCEKKRKTSKPSWMHFVKVGVSLCLAQLDLQEASTEACSREHDQCGSVPTVTYGLLSWFPWGEQGPPATEGSLTGPPSVSAFHMLQRLTSHQKSNPTWQATIPYSQ